jgi:hypothetical protein
MSRTPNATVPSLRHTAPSPIPSHVPDGTGFLRK